mgnify:CR=1 FL=1
MLNYMGPQGWFNRVLIYVGLVSSPVRLIHNYWGVFCSLIIAGFPFTFLMTLSYLTGVDPAAEEIEIPDRLPYIVAIIDELADLVGLKPQVAAITEQAMRGEIEYDQSLRERLALLKGLDESALLRVYEGCARTYLGEIEDTNLVKLHRTSGKVSYLSYPDFETDPHPALMRSVMSSQALTDLEAGVGDGALR